MGRDSTQPYPMVASRAPELVAIRVVLRAVVVGFLALLVFTAFGLGFWWARSAIVRVLIAALGSLLVGWCVVLALLPACRFAFGVGRFDTRYGSFRWRCSRVVALLAVTWPTVVCSAFVRCMVEQLGWLPVDRSVIDVTRLDYAADGIQITVRSAEPVVEVWRQRASLMPWSRQHEAVAFRARRVGEKTEHILVEYPLVPGSEWLLALRSSDGYWVTMSPYFPDAPTMNDQAWTTTWSAAERRVPR